jgi:TatD DNase family protein
LADRPAPELTDTHCHIQSIGQPDTGEYTTRELWKKAGEVSADQVISEAAAAGVTRMLCVGCELDDSRLAIEFVRDQPSCWATIGLHPHEAERYAGRSDKLQEFSDLADQPKVVAVGECGLDFYYDHSPRDAQIKVLKFQIELALEHDLPLIFHVREAFDDFWPVFDSYKGIRGVLHSFTDSAENLTRAQEHGLFIGVNGIATFAKDEALLGVYRTVPLPKLILETDAPFLTPNPYRGRVNEPKYVGVVADFLAELRGENRDLLVSATTDNACRLFGI